MTRPARLFSLLALALTAFSATAAGRPLAPRPLAPTTYYTFGPASAFAGGRFLTVWHELMGLHGTPLMAAFSDASGAKLSPRSFPLLLPTAGDPSSFQLVGTGDSFTLFWVDAERRTHMADVDLEGRVTNARTVALPEHGKAIFAWNGTHFAGVLQSIGVNATRAVLFDRNGQIVLRPASIAGNTYGIDLAVAGERFVAFTSSREAVMAHELTPAGIGDQVLVDHAPGSALAGYRPTNVVAAPAGGGDVIAVWGATSIMQGELKSAIVRADGTRTAETLLATGTGEVTPLEVLRTGDGYLVAFLSGGALYRVRLNAAGGRDGEPVSIAGDFANAGQAAAGAGTILVPISTRPHSQIATVAIAAEGQPRPAEIVSIGYSRQLQPILGAGGGDVFAAWTEFAGAALVRGTAVGADGEPRVPVHVAPAFLASAETAWNGVHHLILHHDTTRLMATRVAADGTVAGAAPIAIAELGEGGMVEAAAAWTGARWVVVWSDTLTLQSVTVSGEGTVSEVRTLEVPANERNVRWPALAFDGKRVLLLWTEYDECWFVCVSPPSQTRAIRLTRAGALSDLQPVDVELPDAPNVSVATSGSEFLVVGGPQARVLDDVAGRLRVTSSRDLFHWPALSDVTWDGASYAVALRYYGANTDWYLGVLRLDRAGNDAAVRRATATLTPDVEAPPSIAAPFAGNALIGVQEGTVADGVSATVYRERDLAPLPAPPSPARSVRVHRISSFEFEVTWQPPAEGQPGSYIVEQEMDGTWQTIARVPGDVRRIRVASTDGTPVIRVRAFNAGGPSAVPSGDEPRAPKRRSVR